MNLFEMMGITEPEVKVEEKKDTKKATGTKKNDSKTEVKTAKVEEKKKYKLPIKVYYIAEYELTPEDFGGLEEVTEEQITHRLRDHYELFMFDEKRVTFDYMEERNTLIAILKSPRKGGIYKAGVNGERSWIFESDYMSFSGGAAEGGSFEERAFDKPFLTLKYGKIPFSLLENIISIFREQLPYEYLAQIFIDTEKGEYFIDIPEQEISKVTVDRDRGYLYYKNDIKKPLVCEMHSHNFMLPLFFSGTDNEAEVDFKLYGIVGFDCRDNSKVFNKFRIGTNGTFRYVNLEEIFELSGGK